jgi:hypothetical protein
LPLEQAPGPNSSFGWQFWGGILRATYAFGVPTDITPNLAVIAPLPDGVTEVLRIRSADGLANEPFGLGLYALESDIAVFVVVMGLVH